MCLNDLIRKTYYRHKKLGKVLVIDCHPHDGACLIVEYEKDDETYLDYCEASDLEPLKETK